ncbi:MAG: hypothetical protein WBB39_04635 [Candidatus Saccharimonadales bacterium]
MSVLVNTTSSKGNFSRRRVVIAIGIAGVVIIGYALYKQFVMRPMPIQTHQQAVDAETARQKDYVESRPVIDAEFRSIDEAAKRITVYVTKDKAEHVYSYEGSTQYYKGISYTTIRPADIVAGAHVFITYNTKTKIVESIWQP